MLIGAVAFVFVIAVIAVAAFYLGSSGRARYQLGCCTAVLQRQR